MESIREERTLLISQLISAAYLEIRFQMVKLLHVVLQKVNLAAEAFKRVSLNDFDFKEL